MTHKLVLFGNILGQLLQTKTVTNQTTAVGNYCCRLLIGGVQFEVKFDSWYGNQMERSLIMELQGTSQMKCFYEFDIFIT